MSIEVVVVDPHVLMIESIVDLAADCRSGDIAELVVIDAHLRVAVAGQVDNPIIGDAVEQAAADAAADRADVDLARVAGEAEPLNPAPRAPHGDLTGKGNGIGPGGARDEDRVGPRAGCGHRERAAVGVGGAGDLVTGPQRAAAARRHRRQASEVARQRGGELRGTGHRDGALRHRQLGRRRDRDHHRARAALAGVVQGVGEFVRPDITRERRVADLAA